MKKLIILVLFSQWLIGNLAYAQKTKKYNELKVNDEKITHKICVDIIEKKVKEKKENTYYWYSANGIHTSVGGYEGKLLQSEYSALYLDNNLAEKGFFKDGLKDGEWKKWYPNGKLMETVTYKNGQKDGLLKSYAEDGSLKSEENYKKDVLSGSVRTFENNKLVSEKKFKKGVEIVKEEKEKKDNSIYEEKPKKKFSLFKKKDKKETTPDSTQPEKDKPKQEDKKTSKI